MCVHMRKYIYPPPCPCGRSGVPPIHVPAFWRVGMVVLRAGGPPGLHDSRDPAWLADPISTPIFERFPVPRKIAPEDQKSTQRGPKRYPLDTIFGRFGPPGGTVKTMVSCTRNHHFHGWRGSRGAYCTAPCDWYLPTCSSERLFLDFCRILLKFGPPRGGPTNQLFHHFFDSAPLGGPLGGPGSPNDPQGHQNDTKIDKKSDKMTPTFTKKDIKMTPK